MIDIKHLIEEPELYRASQRARGAEEALVDRAISAHQTRSESITRFESLRAEQKAFGKRVAQAEGEQKQALLAEVKDLADQVKEAETASKAAEVELGQLQRSIPNLVHQGVPSGGEEDSVVLRHEGAPRDFTAEGVEVRDHLALAEALDAVDMERGAKVSGSRFYFLKGIGARLELAMMQMGLDQALEHGFTPMITPTLVRPETMQGTGFDVEHDDEIYRLERDGLYLVGTSEVSLAGYHADEILEFEQGPVRYAGWSTCYRREAGSHGKDTRGILRVHQFNKLEMFVYCAQEDSTAEHERMLAWEEAMLQKMELPYRVVDIAAGDLGMSAARKFDCEAWVPSQGTYRELTSTSDCTTFQARRLNIRERTVKEDGSKGATRPVAMLNGTLATTRWLVAILENHQQADGAVRVPEALRPYLGGLEVLSPVR
ncbi:serine--tRNA ligase [Nesterenkonia aerolata]|uniref:Serine--tRNA ligase n=1 Tax=Nesterenkonia aerolata TaxID=3074079 RepID=A0ABU2DU63_9MICC|nr:serine--tRNA ligase [Nesterenkonia sp. LY-0111]MDR8020048.1 serine--tRNA ligase [Nesterenkonia sp. LY-0111]